MEHLLAPANSQPIKIPYLQTEEFEANNTEHDDALVNFKSYWERKGWKRNPKTGVLIFEGRTPREIARSLQTSLYFGCLITVFRIVGIHVHTLDFLEKDLLHKQTFVHTGKLLTFVAMWKQREGFAVGPGVIMSPRHMRGENIKEILNWTSWYLQEFCEQSKAMAESDKRQLQLIELSIMAMAESLCSVAVAIYGYQSREIPAWGPSPILQARLKHNGWCVSDSPFFPESVIRSGISSDYYFGGSHCPRQRQHDHSGCTTAICREFLQVIQPASYKQAHTSRLCSCSPVVVPQDRIVELVDQRKIPVINWDGNRMHVSAGGAGRKYVALSHVWSDGLGNDDKRNALPSCQLSRLQWLVNQLYGELHWLGNEECSSSSSYDAVPFWIDTLCVPVGVGEVSRQRRTRVIGQMADIYKGADRVLVLDSFNLTLTRSADIIDKYLHIHLSSWHHRLWTMQEGQLARNLFFQFQDGAQSFYDMRSSTSHTLDPLELKNLFSPIRVLCAAELEAFYRIFAAATHMHITTKMRLCAKYLRSRQTSRSDDEAVCLATILGLDPGPVLAHKSATERMASLYDMVGYFDPRIIFNEHPRLPKDGYRWAPRSFIHQVRDVISIREGGNEDNMQPTLFLPGGRGLRVQFAGLEFDTTTLCAGAGPLASVFIRSTSTSLSASSWGNQQWSTANKAPWWACTYRVQVMDLLPEMGLGEPAAAAGVRYAIILPGHLHPDDLPAAGVLGIIDSDVPRNTMSFTQATWRMWTTDGVAGMQRPSYSVKSRLPVRYIGRVHVSMPAQEAIPANVSFLLVKAYSRAQEWCVR